MTAVPVVNVSDMFDHCRKGVHMRGNELISLLNFVCVNYILQCIFRNPCQLLIKLSTTWQNINTRYERKNERQKIRFHATDLHQGQAQICRMHQAGFQAAKMERVLSLASHDKFYNNPVSIDSDAYQIAN